MSRHGKHDTKFADDDAKSHPLPRHLLASPRGLPRGPLPLFRAPLFIDADFLPSATIFGVAAHAIWSSPQKHEKRLAQLLRHAVHRKAVQLVEVDGGQFGHAGQHILALARADAALFGRRPRSSIARLPGGATDRTWYFREGHARSHRVRL